MFWFCFVVLFRPNCFLFFFFLNLYFFSNFILQHLVYWILNFIIYYYLLFCDYLSLMIHVIGLVR
jgi:hypothetical protein